MADLIRCAERCAEATASYHHAEFTLEALLRAKGSARVVVCIPARDEGATIASIVATIRAELGEGCRGTTVEHVGPGSPRLVDEILVVDDNSSDDTAEAAAQAGAVVTRGPGLGKGEAMGLARGRGDVVVYLDGDVLDFPSHFVTGLLGPLLLVPGTMMVKGRYERPTSCAVTPSQAAPAALAGGGRVTELVAKPLLSLLFPELSWLSQPLAGETAVRSELLDRLELAPAYGVEIGLLVDVWHHYGNGAIAEVDLGQRVHRNRPLHELASQARDVMGAALARAGLGPQVPARSGGSSRGPGLLLSEADGGGVLADLHPIWAES